MKAFAFFLFLLQILQLLYCSANQKSDDIVRSILRLRLSTLRRFALSSNPKKTCSKSQYLIISEFPWGRTGNQIISFTHGVWFADKLNATLVVPKYMHNIFDPFDTTTLQSLFCYTLEDPGRSVKTIEITSEDMFFGFKVYNDPQWKNALGPFTSSTRVELSRYLLKVYASMWGSPKQVILDAASFLIENYLRNNFQYSAVHMRQLEGGCSKVMGHVTSTADFSPKELPMDREEWKVNLHKWHPLCDMDFEFVNAVFLMHNRNNSKIFVAHDTHSNIKAYRDHEAVFSTHIQNPDLINGYEIKYLDMFMCINADIFILNPRSTFSFQIMATRLILSLLSVPIIRNNDIFLQKIPEDLENSHRNLWITWESMVKALD